MKMAVFPLKHTWQACLLKNFIYVLREQPLSAVTYFGVVVFIGNNIDTAYVITNRIVVWSCLKFMFCINVLENLL